MWNRVFLNRYRALRLLGEGGMGRAYLARQLDQDRLVVVKVLHEKYASNKVFRESLRREMDLLCRFRHPGAVEFYEASMDDPQGPCLVMEYIEGEAPDELLQRQGRLDYGRVGRLLGHLCAVLHAAHAQGIIHRDLKPGNLLVVQADTPAEHLKVLDFGLARLTVSSPQGFYIPMDKFTDARANATVGTPEYMCPEALRGDLVDHRGDLYSVGVILYELLTGHLPFEGSDVNEILSAHAHKPPPPFFHWGSVDQIPAAVEAVVKGCLAKDPADRPQSARELAQRYGEASGQKIWDEQAAAAAIVPLTVPSALAQKESEDSHGVTYHLEAWMPEQIAAVKLRGFLDEAGGDVVESVPGLVRVRFPWRRIAAPQPAAGGLWSRLGLAKQAAPVPEFDWAHMDVHFEKPAAHEPSRLLLKVRFRPEQAVPEEAAAHWQAWCELLHGNLKGYLMSQK
jgi:serine/threonine-protein kinase